MDISETIRQAQGGDTAAFAVIVRQYQSLVVTFLEKKGDLRGAVEECTKALRWLDEDASSRSFFTNDFLRRRAGLYENLGEHDKAKADLERAK